jgi:four helix bundle protein
MGYGDLHVHQAAVLLRDEVDTIIKEVKGNKYTLDQLDRAAESVLLNIAEARGQRTPGQRCNFYGMARGSSDETRRCLQTLVRRGAISWTRAFRAIGLTFAIGKMLTSLIRRIANDRTSNTTRPQTK